MAITRVSNEYEHRWDSNVIDRSIDRAHAFDRIEFGESIECVADRVRVYAPPPRVAVAGCVSIDRVDQIRNRSTDRVDRPRRDRIHRRPTTDRHGARRRRRRRRRATTAELARRRMGFTRAVHGARCGRGRWSARQGGECERRRRRRDEEARARGCCRRWERVRRAIPWTRRW